MQENVCPIWKKLESTLAPMRPDDPIDFMTDWLTKQRASVEMDTCLGGPLDGMSLLNLHDAYNRHKP